MSVDDRELIDICLAGNPDAFGQLVVRHQDRLFNSLVKLLGSVHDAADVAQDAFVLAFQNLKTYERRSAFYTWLFRIAFNASVSRRRKLRRLKSLTGKDGQTTAEPVDWRPDAAPSHSMELDEQHQIIHHALAELSDEYRDVLVMKELEGLKYEEIAEVLNCPLGTVRSRIHRARGELRDKLKVALKE